MISDAIREQELKKFFNFITFGFEFEVSYNLAKDNECKLNMAQILKAIAGSKEDIEALPSGANPCKEVYHTFQNELKSVILKNFPHAKFYGGKYHGKANTEDPNLFRFEVDNTFDIYGFELITPPMKYTEALKKIPSIINVLKNLGGYTTNRHGFHIHISEKDTNKFRKTLSFLIDVANGGYKGLSTIYFFTNYLAELGDLSFALTDKGRKTNEYSMSIDRWLMLSPSVARSQVKRFLLKLPEVIKKKAPELENKISEAKDVKVNINIPLDFLIYAKKHEVRSLVGIDILEKQMEGYFAKIASESHMTDIRVVGQHYGLENRAPGGVKALDTFSNPNKLKYVLIDTLWRYFILFEFERAMKFFSIDNVLKWWNEFYVPAYAKATDVGIYAWGASIFFNKIAIKHSIKNCVLQFVDKKNHKIGSFVWD